MSTLAVAIGGGLGALARYWIDGIVAERQRGPFPAGTFVINVTGCAAVGAVAAVLDHAGAWSLRYLLQPGFLGAYTTFSTFTYETVRLVEDSAWPYALLNAGMSLVCGLGATAVTFYGVPWALGW